MGYNFTGGRIFDFPIDFSMGLTTVQRCNALPVINNCAVGMLKLTTDKHEASRGLSATAELLVPTVGVQ